MSILNLLNAEVQIHGSRVAMLRGRQGSECGRCGRLGKEVIHEKEKKKKKKRKRKEKEKKERNSLSYAIVSKL